MRPDLFVFPNVVPILVFASHQSPDSGYLLFSHIQHPRSFWGIDPFVKGSTEVVAAEIRLLEIELCERMCSVDYRFDPACTSHIANLFDGIDLTGEIDLMRNENQFRFRGHRSFK